MIAQNSQRMELGTYLGLLIIGLIYLCWATNSSLFIIFLLASVLLGLIALFFYYHHEEEISSYFQAFRPRSKPLVHYHDDSSYVSYTLRDINAFKQKDSIVNGQSTVDHSVGNCWAGSSDFNVDNTAIYNRYKDVLEESEEPWSREKIPRQPVSFGEKELKAENREASTKKKRAVFDIGVQVKDRVPLNPREEAFKDREAKYRVKRIESNVDKILTGLMTLEELESRYGVKYIEKKAIKETTPIVAPIPKTTTTKFPTTSTLFDQKSKPLQETPPKQSQLPKQEKKETEILPGLKTTLFEVAPKNTEIMQEGGSNSLFGPSKPLEQKVNTISFGPFEKQASVPEKKSSIQMEPISSELHLEIPKGQINPPVQKIDTGFGIFGRKADPPTQNTLSPPAFVVSEVIEEHSRVPQGGQARVSKLTEKELNPNSALYLELSKSAKDSISSQICVTKEKMAQIKESVSDFFSKICSSVDEDFLMKCQGVINELDNLKYSEEEYLAFIFEFVTSYILEYMSLMSSNKVKIIYSGVFFQIISIYHSPLLEVIQAIAFKKYPWLKGHKVQMIEDKEEYLMSIGFNNFTKTVNFRSCKSAKEYETKVAAEIAKNEDGGSKFEKFYNRLDFYTLVLFTVLSTDLRVQLRDCNCPLATTYLTDWKPAHEHFYFSLPRLILEATPTLFWPVVMRNWMNVGSDIWDQSGAKMFEIIKYFKAEILPKLDKEITSESAEFGVFNHKNIIRDLRASTIAFREDVLEIIKKGFLKQKDIIFDPDRES